MASNLLAMASTEHSVLVTFVVMRMRGCGNGMAGHESSPTIWTEATGKDFGPNKKGQKDRKGQQVHRY